MTTAAVDEVALQALYRALPFVEDVEFESRDKTSARATLRQIRNALAAAEGPGTPSTVNDALIAALGESRPFVERLQQDSAYKAGVVEAVLVAINRCVPCRRFAEDQAS